MSSRYPKSVQQEQKSRAQIEECFTDMGWVATPPKIDLGEDYLIHIYLNGAATGIVFHLQAKSVTDIDARRRKGFFAYPLEVKDLLHWKDFGAPVVVVIWDVNQRIGYWALVSQLIARLDHESPTWRKQKRATVHVPAGHTMDRPGLTQLKELVGSHFFPQIAQGRNLEVKVRLDFSASAEAEAQREAFERHIRRGDPVVLKGRVIQGVSYSSWWQDWVNPHDPDQVEMHIGPGSPVPITLTLDAVGAGVSAHLPGLPFQIEQMGTEYARLSTRPNPAKLKMTVDIHKLGEELQCDFTVSATGFARSVADVETTLHLFMILAAGGQVTLVTDNPEGHNLPLKATPGTGQAPDPRLVELVHQLKLIQERLAVRLEIPEGGLTADDIRTIQELGQVLSTGKSLYRNATASFCVRDVALAEFRDAALAKREVFMRETSPDSYFTLFGQSLETGPLRRDISGLVRFLSGDPQVEGECDPDSERVEITPATIIDTFSRWSGEPAPDV